MTEEAKRKEKFEICKKRCELDWEEDIQESEYTPLDYKFEKMAENFCRTAHLENHTSDLEKGRSMKLQYTEMAEYQKDRALRFWGKKKATK